MEKVKSFCNKPQMRSKILPISYAVGFVIDHKMNHNWFINRCWPAPVNKVLFIFNFFLLFLDFSLPFVYEITKVEGCWRKFNEIIPNYGKIVLFILLVQE